jgi:hypothetical protein
MSVISSINCPLCHSKNMQEDYFFNQEEVFYHCHSCGYGNLFTTIKEDRKEYWKWDRRQEKRKFLRWINVRKKHELMLIGKVPFYPIGAEFPEYMVFPRSKKGKLIWKLYSPDKELLGEFKTLGDAFLSGDKYADLIGKD